MWIFLPDTGELRMEEIAAILVMRMRLQFARQRLRSIVGPGRSSFIRLEGRMMIPGMWKASIHIDREDAVE